jgi:transcriptional regulator with XRE-family HTH domain
MTMREVVAKNLRRMRQAKGLSQEELADRAGINRNYVGMLEREEHAATVDMLEKLAEVLKSTRSSSSIVRNEWFAPTVRPLTSRRPICSAVNSCSAIMPVTSIGRPTNDLHCA